MSTSIMAQNFPPELFLNTIEHLGFGDGKTIANLRATHPRWRDILDNYHLSVANKFMERELRHATIDFPSSGDISFSWLASCVKKYDVVDNIMPALCPHCSGLMRYNESLVNTGFLLIYSIESHWSHTGRLAYIKSLSCDPLTAIYLAVHYATLTARSHSKGWISYKTYSPSMDAEQFSVRKELEFNFAEATLNIGPEFISNMLLHHSTSGVEAVLLNFYHNHAEHDWNLASESTGRGNFEPPRTQGPHVEPGTEQSSLWTTLLERLAELLRCEVGQVGSRIERFTGFEDHPLAHLGLWGKAVLMQGHDLEDA